MGAARFGIDRECSDFSGLRSGVIEWDETANRLWGFEKGEPVTYEMFEAGLHSDDKGRVRADIGEERWPRLFGQISRFDKWNVCRG
jgi:hypothetical protein